LPRALYILLILYFPVLLALVAQVGGDFRPDILESPMVRALFFVWLGEGLFLLTVSIAVMRREIALGFRRVSLIRFPLGLVGAALGVVPAYLAVDLALKLYEFLSRGG